MSAVGMVSIMVPVAAAEFEFVPAMNPGHRAGNIQSVLIGISRAGNGIADGGEAGNLNEGRADGGVQRRLILEAQTRGSDVVQMLVEKKFIAQK